MTRYGRWASIACVGLLSLTAAVVARKKGGAATLPYTSADGRGNTWMVFQPSCLQMQGNWPIYAQAGLININGTQPNAAPAVKVDDKTGELVLENIVVGSFTLTRRVQFNTEDGYVRVIDIVKNTTQQDQSLNLNYSSNTNYGVQGTMMIPDPRKPGQNLAWVAQTAAGMSKAACDVYNGSGCKTPLGVDGGGNNNAVSASVTTNLPAGKEIAFAHLHMVVTSMEQGSTFVKEMKEPKLFADVPKEVRRLIVNFRIQAPGLADLDLLRGDVLDVVELRTGDKYNGNLNEPTYKLDTFYGTLELPSDKVISILNFGQFRPRQLVVLADGQVFGGRLQKQTVDVELSTGQKTSIPLAQVNRIGYRRRPKETDETNDEAGLQPPYIVMTTGDRVTIKPPADPITVVSRYGQIPLPPDVLSGVVFTSDESGVHTIQLTDGSHFSGLVTATNFDLTLTATGTEQKGSFPVGSINRIVLKNKAEEKDEAAPTLALKKDDLFVGTLKGTLKLDTAFDTIALNAAEIRSIGRAKDTSTDVTVTTWDGTTFTGQLQDQSLQCHLNSGLDVQVPVGLLDSFTNPVAQVPAMVVERIKAIVTDLNAEEWKQREAATQQLAKLGPAVIPTLKSMRDAQTPEGQQRIDTVIKQLQK